MVRRADLIQLEQIATTFPSRERFLTELTLDPPDASSDRAGVPLRDEDYLVLSTIHSAKGQEWKSVFVLNAVDGCIPSDLGTGTTTEIEEERRLLYVAMTRAKDELDLIVPQRFLRISKRQAAIAMSMRREAGSCQIQYCHSSIHELGPRLTGTRTARRRQAPTWMWVHECALCGARANPAPPRLARTEADTPG